MCMGVRPPVTTAVHHSAAALKGHRKIKMKWNDVAYWSAEDWDTDKTCASKRAWSTWVACTNQIGHFFIQFCVKNKTLVRQMVSHKKRCYALLNYNELLRILDKPYAFYGQYTYRLQK